jgi:signal transduction histidine kinase
MPPLQPETFPLKSDFLLKAIHDLGAPLRKVHIRAQLLEESKNGEWTEDERTHLNAILEASRSANLLLARLSEYSVCASDAGPQPSIPARLMIAGVISRLGPKRGDCQVEVVLAEPDAGMPQRIEKVFAELLDNAFKFRPAAIGRVVVSNAGNDQELRFSIQDDGIGFDPKFGESILKPLERLHTPAEFPGFGMGLAICDRLLQAAGGSLRLDSTVGQGTIVHFSIPRVTFSPV